MKHHTTAKDREAFVQRVRDIVIQAGGRDDLDTSINSHVIPVTTCGPLFVSVHEANGGSEVGWVACRFMYPELAAEVIRGDRLNRCSGKWNHHYFSPWSVDDAVADFERSLGRFLTAGNGEADANGQRVERLAQTGGCSQ